MSLLDLIASDPVHHNAREAVITAIRTAVTEHGDVISSNEIRPHLAAWIYPKAIGATISHLVRQGALEPYGPPVRSTDTAGGNAGRWIPRYRVDAGRLG